MSGAVGLQLTVVFVASLAGFTAGLSLNVAGPVPSLAVAAFTCLAIFIFARVAADAEESRRGRLLLLAVWAFACTLLLPTLSDIVRPRRISRDLPGLLAAFVRLLGAIVVAVGAPTAAVLAGLRRALPSDTPPAAPRSPGPAGAQALLSLAFAVTMLLGLVLTLLIRDAAWRLAAVLSVALAWPILTFPVAALAFRVVVARHVVAAPAVLREALERVSERTSVTFARVLCLDETYGGGRIAVVIGVPGAPTLAISSALVERLTPAQLLAVLVHEAAHVRFGHMRRKLAWSTVLTLVTVASGAVVLVLLAPLFPRSHRFLANFIVLFPLLVAGQLYEALVTRRHEAEADRLAVQVAGGDAVLGALETIQGAVTPIDGVHERWTTHGTWERRAARIRDFAQRAADDSAVAAARGAGTETRTSR